MDTLYYNSMRAVQFNPNLFGGGPKRSKWTYLFLKAHKLKSQCRKNLEKVCIPCKKIERGGTSLIIHHLRSYSIDLI
jgi:hypothetical protein